MGISTVNVAGKIVCTGILLKIYAFRLKWKVIVSLAWGRAIFRQKIQRKWCFGDFSAGHFARVALCGLDLIVDLNGGPSELLLMLMNSQ